MKKLVSLILAIGLMLGLMSNAYACTGIVVGKNASADGSLIMGRTEDIGAAYNKTFKVNPATTGEGTTTVEDPYNGFVGEVPATGAKWTMLNDVPEHDDGLYPAGSMNEYGVSMTGTISTSVNDSVKEFDPLVREGGLREAYIHNVVMPFATTAREGVQILGNVVETYGSAEANTVIFADADEIWVMEIVSGHQWAAARVPDDCYGVIPNCMMLGYIDVDDTENYLCSEGLFSMPEENGFLKTYNDLPHVALTYGTEMADGNRVRAWGGQHFFSASQDVPYDTEVFSVFMKADAPISLTDAMALMAYRYEGTEYDANTTSNRAIGTERTCEAHLYSYREGKELVQWVAMGNAEDNIFMPAYVSITETPDAFQIDGEEYNADSAYWTFRSLTTLAEIDRENIAAGVKEYWAVYQQELIEKIEAADAEIAALEGDAKAEYANNLFAEISADAMAKANTMKEEIMFYLAQNSSMNSTPRAPFSTSLMPAEAE